MFILLIAYNHCNTLNSRSPIMLVTYSFHLFPGLPVSETCDLRFSRWYVLRFWSCCSRRRVVVTSITSSSLPPLHPRRGMDLTFQYPSTVTLRRVTPLFFFPFLPHVRAETEILSTSNAPSCILQFFTVSIDPECLCDFVLSRGLSSQRDYV